MKRKHKRKMLITLGILLTIVALLFTNYISIGRIPSGERLERCRKSPNYRSGMFVNQEPTIMFTDSAKKQSRTSVIWNFLFASKKGLRPEGKIEVEPMDTSAIKNAINLKQDKVIWFGHSSYLLIIGGKTILVDPVLYRGSPVSFINRPFKGTSIYKADDFPFINYLVITHDHYDHLDYKAVRKLKNKVGCVVTALGVGSHLEYWGYEPSKIIELDWSEKYSTADNSTEITFNCTPARHFSGRSFKRNRTLWASFVVEVGDKRIFIGGDGGYGKHFKEIGQQFEIDWAFIENGQYNSRWANIHTMPQYLHNVMEDLDAKHYITVHHSKFALARHNWEEPLANERKAAEDSGKNLLVLQIGKLTDLQ